VNRGSGGRAPSGVQGQSPWSGVRGRSPWSWKLSSSWISKGDGKSTRPTIFLFYYLVIIQQNVLSCIITMLWWNLIFTCMLCLSDNHISCSEENLKIHIEVPSLSFHSSLVPCFPLYVLPIPSLHHSSSLKVGPLALSLFQLRGLRERCKLPSGVGATAKIDLGAF